MRFTITTLGGSGRSMAKIVGAIVDYLRPRIDPGAAQDEPTKAAGGAASPARYYADGGDEPGRWRGHGSVSLGLPGSVDMADFAKVLAGRDPRTGARLITAQGSAGRRPKLGVGNQTRHGPDGSALYDTRDAGAVLDLSERQAARLVRAGSFVGLARLFQLPLPVQPEASYLVPLVDETGEQWITEQELSRCEDALAVGSSVEEVAAGGLPDDVLHLAEAARLAGVTSQYLGRLAKRYEADKPSIDFEIAEGRQPRRAYLVAHRGGGDRWMVARRDLADFVRRRRPPAVRVGYDLTLTTEKSLGVLALLSGLDVHRAVLDAIEAGNDHAIDWLEQNAAAVREDDKAVQVKSWTVATFRHLTSRALDPFPHHHNVIANTAEKANGERRALDARGLYQHAKAASALATAEMRYQLTRRLGVRWRPSRSGGWEVEGIPDEVLRAFSTRRNEIEDALRELEEAIGRGTTLDEVNQVVLKTRPGKQHVAVPDLLAGWWTRAEELGFAPDDLRACLGDAHEPLEPDRDAIYEALAAADGICANLSIFNRGDLLAALTNLPIRSADNPEPQPPIVPAEQLEEIADGFLESASVVPLTNGGDDRSSPPLYTTTEILAVQDRIVRRFQTGLRRNAARVPDAAVDAALARHPDLDTDQQALVRAFCTSGHKVQCAVGHPGAGKTRSMAAARDAWQADGWRVVGAAVKGEAARTLGVTAGIPSETLAWYLAHPDPLTAPLDAHTVLVVDEASTISDRDLDKLLWLAAETGATLRLIGDPAQHGAVEAGGMFRVLCERHADETPQLTRSHRLQNPHDRLAADLLRAGDVEQALDELDKAGHLHIVDDEMQAYTHVLSRWWQAHTAGHNHPMVNRRNSVRRSLNRLAHALLQTVGEVDTDEITADDDRRYAVGDRIVARHPERHLHPPGLPTAYVRNGATGTVVAIQRGETPENDALTVDFDHLGTIELPRSFFDDHPIAGGRHDVGIDHAYALTSYAVTGSTHAVSTSRIDEGATRAETYVDITRGRTANHLYLTRRPDNLDGEHLPRPPRDPLDEEVIAGLERSQGERTAWEIRQSQLDRDSKGAVAQLGL